MRLVAKMKICFVSFPLEKNLKAQEELTKIYGNCNPEDADFIVALGGDGFILKSLHDYLKINKPIFGMNFGSVGFLMNEFKTEDLEIRLKNAQLTKLKPLVMKTISPTGKEVKAIAINEISIRREKYQAAKLQIIVDNEVRMEELVCDGVILSSAAGSTGYNYSASGPIIPLGSNVIALTAVSAYSPRPVSYTHLRAHETPEHLVCRLLLEKKKKTNTRTLIPCTTIYKKNISQH